MTKICSSTKGLGDILVLQYYRDKYIHDNIIASILAYCDNRTNNNTSTTINRYYCESGQSSNTNNPLWDGQHCDGECCAGPGTNSSPPWFSVQLPAPTTDMTEVSICADQRIDDEDIPIGLLEIYVQ